MQSDRRYHVLRYNGVGLLMPLSFFAFRLLWGGAMIRSQLRLDCPAAWLEPLWALGAASLMTLGVLWPTWWQPSTPACWQPVSWFYPDLSPPDAYAFVAPYFLLLGLAVWQPVFLDNRLAAGAAARRTGRPPALSPAAPCRPASPLVLRAPCFVSIMPLPRSRTQPHADDPASDTGRPSDRSPGLVPLGGRRWIFLLAASPAR
jgi:hypothetical protein